MIGARCGPTSELGHFAVNQLHCLVMRDAFILATRAMLVSLNGSARGHSVLLISATVLEGCSTCSPNLGGSRFVLTLTQISSIALPSENSA